MIADVLHFSFTVSDIDASIAWYTEDLGLRLVHRQRQENEYTPRLVGIPGTVLDVAQFAIPGLDSRFSTHMLELVQYVRPDGGRHDLATNRVGVAHLALLVTDLHDTYERMRDRGVFFQSEPIAITEGANAGGYACYLHDPDGITIELMQFSKSRAEALGMPRDVGGGS